MELRAVDRLDVRVLVDNATDLVSSVPAGVEQETDRLDELAGERLCCAHFGLSLWIEVERDGRGGAVLFDAGPEADAVERNGARLGIDFGAAECVVLSHGHWDHAGGLVRALELIRRRRSAPVPTMLHPGMFARRGIRRDGGVLPFRDVPGVDALAVAGATPTVTRDAQPILDGMLLVSGEIPRVTDFERGLPGHVRRAAGGEWEPDPEILDERFLLCRVRRRGLVVFTACSHAGVVNVLLHARSLFPSEPLHAVVGGFHLAGRDVEPTIPATVERLRDLAPARIVPAHCTGWRATSALGRAFGDEVVVPSAVGRRFRFGAGA